MNSAYRLACFGHQLHRSSLVPARFLLKNQNLRPNSLLCLRQFYMSIPRLELSKEPKKPVPIVLQSTPVSSTARRTLKRRRSLTAMIKKEGDGRPQVFGVALAESFDLIHLLADAKLAQTYQMTFVDDEFEDAIHFTPKAEYNISPGSNKEFFLFSDGVLISWHYDRTEFQRLIEHLKPLGDTPYDDVLVQQEIESMTLDISGSGKLNIKNDVIRIPKIENETQKAVEVLVRYAVSHGMAASVKVAIWEHKLNEYSEPLNSTTQSLKNGVIPWRRRECLKRIGEFAALRYSINLNSGLLNTDFYWEREQLDKVFEDVLRYFVVKKRLR
uniref:DUF155 domain-containing protein n=2 Tax=Bursaphelenchus xylophilus TaxID=6326 RepID=A0A1I7RV54_BURXY